MVVSGVLQNKLMTGFASNDKKVLEEAGKLTNEAISNIRTVALLNKEAYFVKAYSKKIDIPYKQAVRSANIFGIMLGFTNSIMFFAMATAFIVGATIVEKGLFGLTFPNIMLVFRYLNLNIISNRINCSCNTFFYFIVPSYSEPSQ